LKEIEAIGAENDSPSRELARGIADSARTYLERRTEGFRPVLEFRPDRYHRGGDHSSFNLEGFAAVRITEWREDYNHQHQNVRTEGGTEYGDVLKFVDFTYVANVARMNAAALATFASAPGEPTDVQIENKVLENTSTLEWKAPQGAPADTAYQIVWRETTAPDWQFAADAATFGEKSSAGEHRVTLPISKDNVIFGVRSVDRAGHRSMVATPGISGRPQPQGS
jgi:hypothetical protein